LKQRNLYLFVLILTCFNSISQNKIEIKAVFNIPTKQIQINQFIAYTNHSNDTLKIIYLNDWSNSYATKTTPLARRFSEEYSTKFHFAKNEDRGFTSISSIRDTDHNTIAFNRLDFHPDVIEVHLLNPINPGETYRLNLNYKVQLPSNTFTRYGVTKLQDFDL